MIKPYVVTFALTKPHSPHVAPVTVRHTACLAACLPTAAFLPTLPYLVAYASARRLTYLARRTVGDATYVGLVDS